MTRLEKIFLIGIAASMAGLCCLAAGVTPAVENMSLEAVPCKARYFSMVGGDAETHASRLAFEFGVLPQHGTLVFRYGARYPTNSRMAVYTATNASYYGADSFTYRCSDGTLTSGWATCTITIVTNEAPVADDVNVTAAQGIPEDITLSVSQHCADDYNLACEIISGPSQGALEFKYPENYPTSSMYVVYTPTNCLCSDSFVYRVSDGSLVSGLATCRITVVNNMAPSSYGITAKTSVNRPRAISLGVYDSHPDTSMLRCTITNGPANGVVAWKYPDAYPTNSSYVVYTPNTNFQGTDTFAYAASDEFLTSPVATCTVTVVSNTPPTASGRSFTGAGGSPVSINLSISDLEADWSSLECQVVSFPSNGFLVYQYPDSYPTNSSYMIYTPNAGFAGTNRFTFRAFDGELYSPVATATISVAANTAPTASTINVSTVSGAPVDVHLSAVDTHTYSYSLVYRVCSQPSNGTTSLKYPDSYPQNSSYITYSPASGYVGTDIFTYVASDWILDSNIGTVTVTVVSNTAPAASNMTVAAVEDTPKYFLLSVGDMHTSQYELECVVVSNPANGTVEYQNPASYPQWSYQMKYTPAPGFVGTNKFTFKCSDGSLWSRVATCTVTVAANAVPVAYNQWIHADPGATTAQYQARYFDPDGQTMSFRIVSLPSNGTLLTNSFASTGYFSYIAGDSFTGTDTFSWVVSDGNSTSAPAVCRILVHNPANRSGQMVIVCVESNLYSAVSNEVDRLKTDLQNEGYSAKIKLWKAGGATTSSNVWQYLRNEYLDTNQFFAGSILIGNLPKPQVFNPASSYGGWMYTDLVYWNLQYFQTNQTYSPPRNIWVSRIIWPGSTFGDEVTLIKRALQANHDYRTGVSRLPHKAYTYAVPEFSYCTGSNSVARLTNAWPEAETSTSRFLPGRTDLGSCGGADCQVAGGELFDETSHGSSDGFMNPVGWYTTSDAHRLLCQVRFNVIGSCTCGAYGGIVNNMIFTRGGGAVLAVGGSSINFAGDFLISEYSDVDFLRRLKAGESMGTAGVQFFAFDSSYNDRTMFYGDLSIRAMAAPSNAMLTITNFTASKTTAAPGEPLTFRVVVNDPDVASTNSPFTTNKFTVEWFMNGYSCGRKDPTCITAGDDDTYMTDTNWQTVTYAFATAGVYTVRVEVTDEWKARAWKEKTITVNRAPVASNDTARTEANHAVTISVLTNDYDPDGEVIVISNHGQGLHGMVSATTNLLVYTPSTNWTGDDSFSYTIRDPVGSTATAAVTVAVAADATRPRLESAWCVGDFNAVFVKFSERVQAGSGMNGAENPANYSVDGGVSVSGALLLADGRTVRLACSSVSTDVIYTLTVSNVADIYLPGNPVLPGSTALFRPLLCVPGVWYDYYHGTWGGWLPDFDTLTPVSSGVVSNFSLSPRLRNTDFAFRYKAMVLIATNGSYTFYTSSDDGSKLFINGSLLANMDGPHGIQEASGVTNLDTGLHDIMVMFCQSGGGYGLTVSWKGPGFAKQAIPTNVLFCTGAAGDAASSVDGVSTLWLVKHFGDTNAVNGGAFDDYDGDGMSNLQEYLAGTDPRDGASCFKIGAICRETEGAGLDVATVPGRLYRIFLNTNLMDGAGWQEYSNFVSTGAASHVTFTDQLPHGYLRIQTDF